MMGCCSTKANEKMDKEADGLKPSTTPMTTTTTGKPINNKLLKQFLSKEDQRLLIKKCRKICLDKYLEPFNKFSFIITNLYLTGFGGMTTENIEMYRINCIVNSTYEIASYDIPGIETIRVPVDDDHNEDIEVYFDEVSAQIDKWLSDGKRVVVHCMCGVSRSAVLVIAYIMKYKKMTLREAYLLVKKGRRIIRPNETFFKQLIDYEKSLYNKTSVKMIEFTNKYGLIILRPDVYVHLYSKEAAEDDNSNIDATLAQQLN